MPRQTQPIPGHDTDEHRKAALRGLSETVPVVTDREKALKNARADRDVYVAAAVAAGISPAEVAPVAGVTRAQVLRIFHREQEAKDKDQASTPAE